MCQSFIKRVAITVIPAILYALTICGQDKIPADLYKAATIPDSLKKDANAVVRYSYNEIIVKAAGKAVFKSHTVVTVLNEKAAEKATMLLFYQKKFSNVAAADMIVYDADGKVIKKYHKGDMYDRSAVSAESIIDDERLMVVEHSIVNYPVTIEQTTELDRNSYLDLFSWQILEPELSVQNSTYKITVGPMLGFRYKNSNTTITPRKEAANGLDTYTWTAGNLKAVKLEEDCVAWRVLPKISFATDAFEYNGIAGDISSWASYGKWQLALNADVCSLRPAREEEVRQMTAGIANDKDKVKFLYGYLQKNMRYVSIQLGLGGLKPFPATFVDEKKYGDCKALANYMGALLKAVNIPSYYAIVRAGENEEPADPNFPFDPFNHIILCVPLKGDTTWLECTSNTQQFGKLGAFTENRNALLITPEGGKLVNTPRSTMADNQFKSEVHIMLNPDGGARAEVKINTSGEYRNAYLSLMQLKLDEQKQALIRTLNMKQPSVLNIQPGDDKDGINQLTLNLEYETFFDMAAGNKQFYRPRVFDLWRLTVPPLEKRKTDYYFDHPMAKTCVTTIDLPPGFEVDALPANASLKFSYGSFSISYNYDAAKNQVISTTTFNLTDHIIPAAKYTELQEYMDNINKAQNKKLVIRRKA
ncbi:hypothetical protein BEL04_23550 [Mucilaginibacter sp. PPCGB 2223]|uniref:DUF3857 domain-containing transglutaminase family protein n=1 Tax=Mucilaginibacter sp. PPCGB 2223 TaxID=1886027 RepID=UPI000825B87B|nr:DUF3857 and transglutaminase domain-containing protein [Mucilaginibacter sp. PPCGB 2223]OCX50285.1 hypothetical protein BEL04_23550 [Mucilaginibacter sp. PPCGB 2223]